MSCGRDAANRRLQYGYVCPRCSASLTPNKGHCCVFCSYGSAPCPPMQEKRLARSDQRQS
ncbi:MAG: GDCCVxC domain-containing (seleno)protein [Hyphomicrobiaceae bacterium]